MHVIVTIGKESDDEVDFHCDFSICLMCLGVREGVDTSMLLLFMLLVLHKEQL